MSTLDFIIFFFIAFSTASFHGAMVAKSKETATGRIVLTLLFTVLTMFAIYIKAGWF